MSEVSIDLDLDFLTVEERQTILAVLKRDEELRYAEQIKKRALKNEIHQLRQQSAIRVGAEQKSRQCVRCHQELGLLFNKGEICPKCKHQVCPNCRLSVQESNTFPWLCTLCYKQRLLPAVAGDWFYAKVEEKYKHDMQSLNGSDVIRSSIKRSRPLVVTDKNKTHSTPDVRNNPFARLPDDRELSAAVSASDVLVETTAERQVADSPKFVHAANRMVHRVMSKGLPSSSGSSSCGSSFEDEGDNKIQDLVLAELAEPSTSSEEMISTTHVEMSLEAPAEAGHVHKKLSTLSEPGLDRSSLLSHSADAAINRSVNPLEPSLLSASDTDRPRSKSAIVYSMPESGTGDDYAVEHLTQVKFRRCSGLSTDGKLSEVVITRSAEQLCRLSPDGCSPYASNEEGAADTAADMSPVPKLSLPASLKGSAVLAQGGSGDEFDEEDIDHIVAEAKKANKGSNLSSHLTMSMESLTSMVSESGADFNRHDVTGEIQYRLGYDKFTGVLTLTVHQCRNLVAVNAKKKTSDPYVKAYLLSDGQKSNKRKTKVKRSSLNPVFEETFRYTLSTGDLQTKVLQLSVWSFHRIGHGDFMGEVNIALDSQMHGGSSNPPQWLPLASKTPKNPDVIPAPELKVALRYTPNQSVQLNAPKADLHVKLISARNLPPKKSGAPADPFVKCVMLPEKVRHKSAVARNNLWEETFTFPKSSISELESSSLELHVYDVRFTANELLGAIKFNLGTGRCQGKEVDWMESSGVSKLLWETVINNPGEWADSWIPLNTECKH